MMSEDRKLPTIAELTTDIEKGAKLDDFNLLLNQPPPANWVKSHPYVSNHLYLPIDKVELMLQRIFKDYKIEITSQGSSFNGVYVTVRVHYLNPVTDEWGFHDGIGAIHLQVKSGSTPADLANINNGALSMAYPHAKTLAIKDACDHFGKLFGADLNRNATLSYTTDSELKRMADEKSSNDLEAEKRIESLKGRYPYDKDLKRANSGLPWLTAEQKEFDLIEQDMKDGIVRAEDLVFFYQLSRGVPEYALAIQKEIDEFHEKELEIQNEARN